MCLAVPFKLTQIKGSTAIGEAMGLSREIRVDFIRDPRPGDFVVVHAGFAIEKLNPQQAELDLQAWAEVEDALS